MAPYWPENFVPAAEITNDDKSSVDSTSIPANITAPSSPIGSAIPLSPAGSFGSAIPLSPAGSFDRSSSPDADNSSSSSSSTSPYTLFYVSIPCSCPSCYYIPVRSSDSSPTDSPASPTSSSSAASPTPNVHRNGRKRTASLLDERFKDLKESHKYYPPPRKMLTVGVTDASADNWYEVALGQDVPPANRASTDNTNPPPAAKKMWLQNYRKNTAAGHQTAPVVREAPAVDTPAVDTPAVDTPAVDTPAVDTPAVDTPAVDTPAVDTPAVDTPAVDTPAVDTPAKGVPAVADATVNVQAENARVGPTLRARPIRTSPVTADRRLSERTGRGQLYREYLAGSLRPRKRTAPADDETALPSRKRGRPAKRRK